MGRVLLGPEVSPDFPSQLLERTDVGVHGVPGVWGCSAVGTPLLNSSWGEAAVQGPV